MAFVLALSLVASGLGLLQPWLTKLLIDDGLVARQMDVVWTVAGAILAVSLLSIAVGGINRWAYVDLSSRVLFAFRERVYAHLMTLSPRFYARRKTGDIMVRLDGDIAELQRFVTDSGLAVVNGLIVLVGCLGFMLVLSPTLTAIAFVLLPLQVLYLRLMRPRVEAGTRALRARAGDIASYLVERLRAMRLIQSVAAADHESMVLATHNRRYRDDLIRLQLLSYFSGAGPGFLNGLATAILFVAGGAMVINEALTLGTLIAFSVYMARASGPVQTFLGLYMALARARVSLDRVRELLDEAPLVTDPASPVSLPDQPRGEIQFDAVSLSHEGHAGPVMKDVNLGIPPGTKVLVTGPSGAGKSTFADLLVRFYDPDRGRITLDGVDLRDLAISDLRRAVALVAQDTLLMTGTVADNIRYSCPAATDAEVRAAAEAAQLGPMLDGLESGIDTPLPELGMTLSGGQRQRVAIARAILQKPRVLILDEATSGLDAETETTLSDALDALFAQSTRIIISHNPRAVRRADMVITIDGGRVIHTT